MSKDKLHLAYGTTEENLSSDGFYNDHREAALDCILENDMEVGDTVHVSEVKTYTPQIKFKDMVWERLNEVAYEKSGESADDWPNCTEESWEVFEKQAQQILHDLLVKNKEHNRLYRCFNSKTYEVTQEMIDEATERYAHKTKWEV